MNTDRLGAFTDAVMAVIITVMVLELKAPEQPTLAALLSLWHEVLSYAVSFLFVAIIWVNHHYLLGLVERTTPALIWHNFVHLFAVSLLPFATAWMARTQFSALPVMVYAGIFVCVNLAYLAFQREVLSLADKSRMPERAKRLARRRPFVTVAIFASAIPAALFAPFAGFGLICAALFFYLRPDPRAAGWIWS